MASMKEIINDLNSFEAQLRRIIELQEKVLSNHDLLQKRDAAEHCMEQTETGVPLSEADIQAIRARLGCCLECGRKFPYHGPHCSVVVNNPR